MPANAEECRRLFRFIRDTTASAHYDTAYVWLARTLRAELATLDTALARVMARP